MQRKSLIVVISLLIFNIPNLAASVFGDIRGIVYDSQQHVLKDAAVVLHSRSSDLTLNAKTSDAGEFFFRAVPIGQYTVTVESTGFAKTTKPITVVSDNSPLLSIHLEVAPVSESIQVNSDPTLAGIGTSTPTSLVSRKDIEQTPGADRSNSTALITNFVPGAYMTHNQLHIRGGHQVTWLVDGVPVPNSNIADTVGPQFDPKDVDYLEAQRGGYSAEYGDRTYGIFNVAPRTGFERNRSAELLINFGNFHQTNDQINFGSHTDRFAYYGSFSANRSDYGLETPIASVIHDQANGLSGFTSLIYNASPKDQLRFVASLRRDFYQVPNDEDAELAGVRDVEHERDAFVNFSWVRTLNSKFLLTVSPFYHFNRADFIGSSGDFPIMPTDKRRSQYAGAQIEISGLTRQHNFKAGFYGYLQRDVSFFGLQATDGSGLTLQQQVKPKGSLSVLFLEDQYKPNSWLTLTGGLRLTHFSGSLTENDTSPRTGASIRIPHVNWVLHGFYGRYYQAPPLATVSGPLLDFAINQGFDFLPLRGERDEEYQAGLTIPFAGWTLDTNYFNTKARNFFDHDALGSAGIFLPLTIERARIRGVEVTVHSPQLWKRGQVYVTYSNQRAQGQGEVTGGLTDFSPPSDLFFLDHDQRHTLNIGGSLVLPRTSYASAVVHYGSGLLDGDGPDHLPQHTTLDLSIGKSFRENWTVSLQTVNVTNRKFLLDNSNTFGGTHFNEPVQVYVELRYRFHY